jgi:hypothetical protein
MFLQSTFFIQFAFNIFGFLTSEIVNLMQIVQKIMNNNIVSHRNNVVFWNIDFVIQKHSDTFYRSFASHLYVIILYLLINIYSEIRKTT